MYIWNLYSFWVAIWSICYLLDFCHGKKPTPTAVSVPVRTEWLGHDGFWSPVSIQVGSPQPQWVQVLVSTASQETWVVGTDGCDGTPRCTSERGGLFNQTQSSSWNHYGVSPLGLDLNLNFTGDGTYGLDRITLYDEVSVASQIVGIITDPQYWTGFLGLGIKPTTFTGSNIPSFLDSMVENKSFIPSHSYGYTAGAYYKLRRVPSSLTLGGFDANRFEPHDVSFDLGAAQSPTVTINEISVMAGPGVENSWKGNPQVLLNSSQADLFIIDSSTPFLWLPEDVCSQFATTLGLTYDEDLNLYTFGTNTSQHETLVAWNLTFRFQIADLPGSSKLIELALSYGAFDLQLSYPYPALVNFKNATENTPNLNYFPLRKALNSTQYTIGRAFLQETYLKVDYERNNFSIYQAIFNSDPANNMNLVDISRPANSTLGGPPETPSGLSKGATAGIVVGIVIVAVLSLGFLACCFRRRRGYKNNGYIKEKDFGRKKKRFPSSDSKFFRWLFGVPEREMPAEIGGSDRFAFEAPEGRSYPELPTKYNSGTSSSGPTAVDMHQHGKAVNAIGHDPNKPVELPYRMSHRFYETDEAPIRSDGRELFEPAEPPTIRYEPHQGRAVRPLGRQDPYLDQETTDISSPSSSSERSRQTGEGSSPVFVVSPVSPGGTGQGQQYGSLLSVARRTAWYISNEEGEPGGGTNNTQQSEESGVSGLTGESRISPEDSISQGEISRRSTVSPIEDSPSPTSRPVVIPTIQEQIEPEDEEDQRRSRARESDVTVVPTTTTMATAIGAEIPPQPPPPPLPPGPPQELETAVTRQIRNSVQQGFNFPMHEISLALNTRTPISAATEHSTYSPARWIEFWRTGRDPREPRSRGTSGYLRKSGAG